LELWRFRTEGLPMKLRRRELLLILLWPLLAMMVL